MKKTLVTAVLIFSVCVNLKAQKQILFKMRYLPQHNYVSTMKMDMNMLMDMTGDTATLNKAKRSGQVFPMKMEMQNGIKMSINTGQKTGADAFPVTMNVQSLTSKMVMNGKEMPMPMNTVAQTIYGTYSDSDKLNIDSIAGKKVDANMKEAMLKTVNGIQAHVKFPDAALKVGETFTQEMPMDIPMAGMNAKMNSKITYKLLSVEGNHANFDLTYNMTMDMAGQQMNMTMGGDGSGKMVFDTSVGFPISMQSNMNINYSIAMPQSDKAKMNGKINMIMDQQTTITK